MKCELSPEVVIPTEVEESLVSLLACGSKKSRDVSVRAGRAYSLDMTIKGQEILAPFRKAVALSLWWKGSSLR
jgi:hypothetical protein